MIQWNASLKAKQLQRIVAMRDTACTFLNIKSTFRTSTELSQNLSNTVLKLTSFFAKKYSVLSGEMLYYELSCNFVLSHYVTVTLQNINGTGKFDESLGKDLGSSGTVNGIPSKCFITIHLMIKHGS